MYAKYKQAQFAKNLSACCVVLFVENSLLLRRHKLVEYLLHQEGQRENKHPRSKLRGIMSLPRTRESIVLDSRFRGNDAASGGVLDPRKNKTSVVLSFVM